MCQAKVASGSDSDISSDDLDDDDQQLVDVALLKETQAEVVQLQVAADAVSCCACHVGMVCVGARVVMAWFKLVCVL